MNTLEPYFNHNHPIIIILYLNILVIMDSPSLSATGKAKKGRKFSDVHIVSQNAFIYRKCEGEGAHDLYSF